MARYPPEAPDTFHDAQVWLRLPWKLKAQLDQLAWAQSLKRQRHVPLAHYLREVLAAHAAPKPPSP